MATGIVGNDTAACQGDVESFRNGYGEYKDAGNYRMIQEVATAYLRIAKCYWRLQMGRRASTFLQEVAKK